MHQLEHFCYTCEIELDEDESRFKEGDGDWKLETYYTCFKCGRQYFLEEDGQLRMFGYAGE